MNQICGSRSATTILSVCAGSKRAETSGFLTGKGNQADGFREFLSEGLLLISSRQLLNCDNICKT